MKFKPCFWVVNRHSVYKKPVKRFLDIWQAYDFSLTKEEYLVLIIKANSYRDRKYSKLIKGEEVTK